MANIEIKAPRVGQAYVVVQQPSPLSHVVYPLGCCQFGNVIVLVEEPIPILYKTGEKSGLHTYKFLENAKIVSIGMTLYDFNTHFAESFL